MTIDEKIDFLIELVAVLPEEGQVAILRSLVEMQGQHLGVYDLDDFSEAEPEMRPARYVQAGMEKRCTQAEQRNRLLR